MLPDTKTLLKQTRDSGCFIIHWNTWNVPSTHELAHEAERMKIQIREDVSQMAKELEKSTTLTHVTFNHVPELERGHYGKLLEALNRNTSIKKLRVENLSQYLFPMSELCDLLEKNETIESLFLHNVYLEDLQCLLDALDKNKGVNTLFIGWCNINDKKALQVLKFLRRNTRVKSLGFSRNTFSKSEIVKILRALHDDVHLESLQLVNDDDEKVEKEEYFALLERNRTLKQLYTNEFEIWYGKHFTDTHVELAVATLRRPARIKVFDVPYDKDISSIHAFMELRSVHSDIRKLPEDAFVLIVKNLLFTDFGLAVLERARKEGLFA